ncbi:hypothetical protein [Paenibacillus daejeonensis]|uniref:hypothetical protein n=1 Tax=Paenibacillus daejeonensis TaxID=135193 RepID=UPI0003713CE9|nr:hypothetical protein [Paenibacillus daejeonensis]
MKKPIDALFQTKRREIIFDRGRVIGEVYTLPPESVKTPSTNNDGGQDDETPGH